MAILWPDATPIPTARDGSLAIMDSRFRYFISRHVELQHADWLDEYRIVITDYIRDHGGETVELLTSNLPDIINRRSPTTLQKFNRLLLALARRTNYQSGSVGLVHDKQPRQHYSVMRDAGVRNASELMSLLRYAEERGLAQYHESSSSADASITVAGVVYVEGLGQLQSTSMSGFVAMWFSPEMQEAYSHGIVPAIEANGYNSDRVDQQDFNSKVDDEIVASIRRARFVVADFSCGDTGARGGVYFEAGFALGLGKQVIFTVRSSDLERVHFDTRQFNHIVWGTPNELQEKLRNRIAATVPHPQNSDSHQ